MVLYQAITKLLEDDSISMHVPGHKNNTIGQLDSFDFRYDMTEINGLDDLHEADGVLHQLNEKISAKYPGYISQMMVNGTTNGILSAIYGLKHLNRTHFIVLEGAHKSVHHALEIAEVSYKVVSKEVFFSYNFTERDTAVITYPTYTGECFDIGALIDHVHAGNGVVVTDEAHGAHLDITGAFPASSMKYSTDIAVQSYHKMLPALTMSSVIFMKSEFYEAILKYIDYFETSSPSYMLMLSMEHAHDFYISYSDEQFHKKRGVLINKLRETELEVTEMDDPSKLLINHVRHSPYTVYDAFVDASVYPEMVTDEGVLLCLPLFHEGDRYPFELLLSRIELLVFQDVENDPSLDLSFLRDKVCRRTMIPYPPGIPIVFEGEVITSEHLKSIAHALMNHVRIEGIKQNIAYYTGKEKQ
ncbi:aminotransferase class V-fold PLP-dependent enzyme [Salinicoccus jeotgali]|uniref:Aminotransferase class V-fold PLP-dependent enzyme n=1 Tax=Salinicoccus jeotgali TaxID=381634 RepID=A0ABP7F3D7_9STAP